MTNWNAHEALIQRLRLRLLVLIASALILSYLLISARMLPSELREGLHCFQVAKSQKLLIKER